MLEGENLKVKGDRQKAVSIMMKCAREADDREQNTLEAVNRERAETLSNHAAEKLGLQQVFPSMFNSPLFMRFASQS